MRKNAFTLAEVLITLGIIGVVAVLTIPNLVKNYQTRAWNTAATVFETKLEEALKVMNTQQTLAGYKTTEDFVNELSKHIKIIKVCDNNSLMECFENKVYWGTDEEEIDVSAVKTASDFGQDDWETNIIGVQFANGTSALLSYNPECKQDPYSNNIKGTSCIAMLYDTSGFAAPNTSNKDLRNIQVAKLGNKFPAAFEIDGTKYSTPFIPAPLTYEQCKASFGVENCCSECGDTDYYAGALKACKDMGGHLFHENDAEKFFNRVFPSGLVDDMDGAHCANGDSCMDVDFVLSMGIDASVLQSAGTVPIWFEINNDSRGDSDIGSAYYVNPNGVAVWLANRRSATVWSICVD